MALYKDKRTGLWRYEFQKNGTRFTGSGFKKKLDAIKAREKHRTTAGETSNNSTQTATTFRDVALLYLDFSERKFTRNTHRQKEHVCRAFLAHTGDLPIDQITTHHLFLYLNTRPTNNNYNAHRRDLCSVFSWAMDVLEVITRNPCKKLEKMAHDADPKYIPPEIDILRLIAATDPKTDERDLILVLLYTAARIDEILRLRWEDVNFSKRVVTKWTRKRKGGGYEPVPVHMTDDLSQILQKRWQTRENERYIFWNPRYKNKYTRRPKLMNGLCKRAGVEPAFGFHALRHFVASYLADSGKVSKKTIGTILGHKNLETTEIYLHALEGSERAAMEVLDGKFGT